MTALIFRVVDRDDGSDLFDVYSRPDESGVHLDGRPRGLSSPWSLMATDLTAEEVGESVTQELRYRAEP